MAMVNMLLRLDSHAFELLCTIESSVSRIGKPWR